MDNQEREQLIKFCIEATAYLHGVIVDYVDKLDFEKMSDEELKREADWLSDMLDK